MKKKLLIVITDVLSVCIAYGLALLLRFDMRYSAVPSEYIRGYLFYIILASVILVSSYTIAKLYRSDKGTQYLRYSGISPDTSV